jgi:hypothetical protein
MPNGKTAELSYEATLQREAILKQRFDVEVVWEHQIHEMLKLDKRMKDFFDKKVVNGPLDPRDAYYGGRTGPYRMVRELTDKDSDLCISYLDIQADRSLL